MAAVVFLFLIVFLILMAAIWQTENFSAHDGKYLLWWSTALFTFGLQAWALSFSDSWTFDLMLVVVLIV